MYSFIKVLRYFLSRQYAETSPASSPDSIKNIVMNSSEFIGDGNVFKND